MPSVVMKRSMRIFGARALRSGTGFWPAHSPHNNHKVSAASAAATESQDWIHLLENSDGGGTVDDDDDDVKGNDLLPDISDSTPDVTPMDIDDKILSNRSELKQSIQGDDSSNVVGRYALVYHRKRKTSDLSNVMFGKKYYRKRCKKKPKRTASSSSSLIVHSVGGDRSGWLASFLNLILRYMSNNAADFRLSRLSSLMLSEPLSLVFSSHGIDFSFSSEPSWATGSGICSIYGSRSFTPLFTLEFSALPSCFMYLHLNYNLHQVLQSNFLPVLTLTLVNGDSSSTDPIEPESKLDPILVVNKTKTKTKAKKRRVHVKPPVLVGTRVHVKPPVLVGTRVHVKPPVLEGTRVHVKPPVLVGTRAHVKPPVLEGTRRSQRSMPLMLKDWTLIDFEDFDPNRCTANILVFEHGESYKVDGAVIDLEMSILRKWSITVTKNRLFHTNFHPLKSIDPYSIDQATKHITWRDSRYDWMLEFVSKKHWSKFSSLHRVVFHRNSLFAREVTVPIFREIEDYVGYEMNGTFVRTEVYGRVREDELTRVMRRKTAIYEMDSDDEQWLEKFNSYEHHEKLSMEDFELIIDASEENLARHPGDDDVGNLYVKLDDKDIVGAVYSYWKRKRKKNHSTLCRIYKLYEPGRDLLHINRVVRKKRTTKTRRRDNNLFWKNFGMKPHEVEEEEKALKECERRNARAVLMEEKAVVKRRTAQELMENADLAAHKAMVALRIAEEAKSLESASLFL